MKLTEIKLRIDAAESLRAVAAGLMIEDRRQVETSSGTPCSMRFNVCLCGGESDVWSPREMKHRDDCIGVQALKLADVLEAPISLL